jgi:hypothetical protein
MIQSRNGLFIVVFGSKCSLQPLFKRIGEEPFPIILAGISSRADLIHELYRFKVIWERSNCCFPGYSCIVGVYTPFNNIAMGWGDYVIDLETVTGTLIFQYLMDELKSNHEKHKKVL